MRPTRSRSHTTPRSKQPTRPSARTPGRRSRTPAAARPRWLRPPSPRVAAATNCAADGKAAKLRLITRRSRLLGAQGELWPNWRYHSFVTDRDDLDTKDADAYHRNHATVELAIKDLKENAGLSRCPSGRFFANGAWLACSVLAHNLTRWTARLGKVHPTQQLTVAATVRNRLLTVAGRLVNHSGRRKLRLPLNWPWANTFTTALQRIRNLPQLV